MPPPFRPGFSRTLSALTVLLVLALQSLAATSELRVISNPELSADGKTVVFASLGDIWTAPVTTGEAKRVVQHPAQEAFPSFSPDGSRVLFCSDRSGSQQLFSIPATGGEETRHSFHSEGNILESISPDGTQALVRGPREHSGTRNDRLMLIDLTRKARELRVFDASAHSAAWSPDGSSLLFCRGGESFYRMGYRGARAASIWIYQMESRTFKPLVREETESLWPMWLPDGSGFYYVSARNGTLNLWLHPMDQAPRALTSYQDDGVITPSISADGSTIVFRRGFGIYIYQPAGGQDPRPLRLWTREALQDVSQETRVFKGCDSADFTADLKPVFSTAGELWRMDTPDSPPERLTRSAAAERSPRFSPDGKWLYFLRDDGLEANFFRARLSTGGLRDEQPVTTGSHSKGQFSPSPDGSHIAWVEATGDLHAAAADGSSPRLILKGWSKPTFDWSPDGRWLAIAAEDRHGNRDILLADSSGSTQPFHLTRHPAFEGSPRWSPDGRWLVFTARRDPSGELGLWRIPFGKNGPTSDPDAYLSEVYGAKAAAISTKGIEPTRILWSADSQRLFFQSRRSSNRRLYSVAVDGGDFHTVIERRGLPVRATADGAILWRTNRMPEILRDVAAPTSVTFPISLEFTRPRRDILELGFRRIWRTIGERFYDANMHGLDWPALRLKYEPEAIQARDSRDFYRVVRQLLGELNASHLAFHRQPWPGEAPLPEIKNTSSHPGLVFDDHAAPDSPLTITRVIAGSPASRLAPPPSPGDVILRIAGEPVTNGSPLHRYFNGAANRTIPVTLRDTSGSERVIELQSISYAKARALDRANRETTARENVAAAHPEAAYLLVPDMTRESYEELAVSIYQASLRAGGLILDFRNNGGGREADRMLGLLCQPVHSRTIPRNGPEGYPVERRPAPSWEKPLVVLCNADTYSNAEIFCHAIQQIQRAPLVGTATAGGVISAISNTIPDVGRLQVPFRGWFRAANGANLDLNGARPEFPVETSPADEAAGRDPQLEKAIAILLEKL